MTISQTPAPARSDLRPTGGTTTPDHPFRWHGRMLSVGALMWAGVMVFTGTAPEITGVEAVAFGIGSGAFQIGLLCLLRVLWRTQALGEGRLARFFLRAETVALSLAICSTFVDAIQVSDLDEPMWLALDLFWPLSMLGMFLIGVRILSGTVTARQAGQAFARLADAVIRAVHGAVAENFAKAHGHMRKEESAVIAMGKLGGYEMTATSDLDLILVYDFDSENQESDGARPAVGALDLL